MLMLRSLVFLVVFYVNTAVFLVCGSWLLLSPRAGHGRAAAAWAGQPVVLKVICGTRYEVRAVRSCPRAPAWWPPSINRPGTASR